MQNSPHLVAAVVALAAALPPVFANAQVPTPAYKTFPNLAFRGITTPASTIELVQAVVDFAPGARDPRNTLQAPRVFTVVDGELMVRIGDVSDTYHAGTGAPVPAGSAVTFTNESPTSAARVFVSTLLPAGVGDPVVDASGAMPAVKSTTTFTSRIPMYGLPPVVDLTQQGYRYDVGYTTPNHVMNQPHLQTITEGKCSYNYLDGQTETYEPGQQAQMHVGRPGNMATSGQVACAFLMTWVRTSGKPNTVVPPAAAHSVRPTPG